ncbi:TetR/AcrR family transcriptional regulator [Novosphingobium terrae]|uniref:TetR/AcrR family transcriptional regulator n=1 Tax=Novosphingobium terrae TaxID=2726189 RepID=UPI001F138F99|nr:TetR/AcrR family transcriptional regulator [Novosphingobium terrae]
MQLSHLVDPASQPFHMDGLGRIMAALIDEWVWSERRLAFAWREGLLLSQREKGYQGIGAEWQALWSGFWQAICDMCGVGAYSRWTSSVFEGEAALHMLPGRRVLDRACLDELCQGWADWLIGRLTVEGPWRFRARQRALDALPHLPDHDDVARRIASAAADVVEHQGMAGLTHRSVAARADVSLGMVSGRFRTSADLARLAFDTIYSRLVMPLEAHEADLSRGQIHVSRRLAMEELMLAVARESTSQSFASQLRYLRGRTSGRILQDMLGMEVTVSPLDAAIFSDLLSGMQRAGIDLSQPGDLDRDGSEWAALRTLLRSRPMADAAKGWGF